MITKKKKNVNDSFTLEYKSAIFSFMYLINKRIICMKIGWANIQAFKVTQNKNNRVGFRNEQSRYPRARKCFEKKRFIEKK